MINWDTICTPKDQGGLGFKSLQTINKAYMTKLAWTLISEKDCLWTKVFKAKHGFRYTLRNPPLYKPNNSLAWKGICQAWNLAAKGSHWTIGNSDKTVFWKDQWIPLENSLMEYMPTNGETWTCNLPVSFFATDDNWKWDLLRPILPHSICSKIALIKAPVRGGGRYYLLEPHI